MYNDCYRVLNLSPGASPKDIKKAYRLLARQWHPDVNKSTEAHAMFIRIAEAYEMLSQNNFQALKPQSAQPQYYNYQRHKDEYNDYLKQAREKAREKARKAYDDMLQRRQLFKESGWYDVLLALKHLLRIVLLVAPLVAAYVTYLLYTIPGYYDYFPLLIALWVLCTWLFVYVVKHFRSFLNMGTFYYTFAHLRTNVSTTKYMHASCGYRSDKLADGMPYRLHLLRQKDVKLSNRGFRQQTVNYQNEYLDIEVPRSRKAWKIHVITTLVKVVVVAFSPFVLPFDSIVWRIIAGFAMAAIVSKSIHVLTRTRSKVGYLYTVKMLLKVLGWLAVVVSISHVGLHPFHLVVNEYAQLAFVGLLFGDCLYEQVLNFFPKKWMRATLVAIPHTLKIHFDKDFTLYNEMPVISFLFPIYKWIFG